jgi:3-hydroxyisobutyrate dehydrogenase-like beta-hydroxyacid dehydrogenase
MGDEELLQPTVRRARDVGRAGGLHAGPALGRGAAEEMIMKVGFIGLGHMGAGMAANLLEAGHELTVYNRTPGKARALVERGARAATQLGDACQGDVVITMLADDAAVEGVVFGEGGIVGALRQGAIHVSMSTISVTLSERLTAAHDEARQRLVAAPVFGRPEAAAAAKLFIVTAGAQDALAACAPLFEAMGQKTFSISSEPRAANLVKLSGNFLSASVIEALGEAMALVAKGGVDRHRYLEVLTSTLFDAPVYRTYGALIAAQKFEPAGFAAPLGHKDIRLTLAAGEALRVPMPFASLLHDRFLNLLARGGDKLDWSAIGQLAARDAGGSEP